jgi:hypothetical protein
MHVHLPTSIHGWRAIAKEIAIIVVGVLIALFFEQVVQLWDWGQKVAASETAMRNELFYDDAPEMIQRASIQPCINAQLDAIRRAVETDAPRAEVTGLIDRLYVPFVTYDSVEHANATASEIWTHMPRERQAVWTQAYAMMPAVDAASAQEMVDAAQLRALRRTGGTLTGLEQDRVLGAVEAVRNDGVRMISGIGWGMTVIPQLHGHIDHDRLSALMKGARLHYGSCVRDLPTDWPKTNLPPLPDGYTPGLAVKPTGAVGASREGD